MKSTRLLVLIIAAAVFSSCGGGSHTATGDGLATIDVAADYPKEEIVLQTIADVEYVPLAISKEVLLSPTDRIFHFSDRYIMVTQSGEGNISVFNRDGSIASHFNRQGRGPGEYTTITDIVFDEEAGEFYVVDILVASRILVYSLAGEHRRTLPLPEGGQINVWNFDGELLLVYDESEVAMGGEYSKAPYSLISKSDGSIVETLDIELPLRYSNMTVKTIPGDDGRAQFQAFMFGFPNHRLGARDLTLADISSDTIYNFTRERILTPAFVRTPSVHASEPRVVWSTEIVAEDFVLFRVTTLDFESAMAGTGHSSRTLMYDRATGRITEPKFTDENNSSQSWSGSYYDTQTPPNISVRTLDPLKLTEAHEKGELSGPLAETAAALKEDDNPVVMIVKFK